jgi:hypothetical protein
MELTMNKWQSWYDSLPENTKAYLGTQKQLWTDRDLAVVAIVGFIAGLVMGLIY